jgi:hypothetical protein
VGGFKVWVKLRSATESFVCLASGHRELMFARTEVRKSDGDIMSCYGPDATKLSWDSWEDVRDSIRGWIPNADIEDCFCHHWSSDEFSRETWRVPRPGQLTAFADELDQPEGLVVLAGADVARGWSGYMDGAVESGHRAARQVGDILRNSEVGIYA